MPHSRSDKLSLDDLFHFMFVCSAVIETFSANPSQPMTIREQTSTWRRTKQMLETLQEVGQNSDGMDLDAFVQWSGNPFYVMSSVLMALSPRKMAQDPAYPDSGEDHMGAIDTVSNVDTPLPEDTDEDAFDAVGDLLELSHSSPTARKSTQ
jgi:hypothetical protein